LQGVLRHRDPQYAGRRQRGQLRRWPGVTCRGLGANTKPMASTLASAAAATASALVMPQILIHMAPSVAI